MLESAQTRRHKGEELEGGEQKASLSYPNNQLGKGQRCLFAWHVLSREGSCVRILGDNDSVRRSALIQQLGSGLFRHNDEKPQVPAGAIGANCPTTGRQWGLH